MVIVFQNKLFSQKKNGLQFSLLDVTMEKQNTSRWKKLLSD